MSQLNNQYLDMVRLTNKMKTKTSFTATEYDDDFDMENATEDEPIVEAISPLDQQRQFSVDYDRKKRI